MTNAEIKRENKEFFDEAFTNQSTGKRYNVPYNLRRASEEICNAFGIRGISDPMYIVNIIALEMGLGDGKGNFTVEAIDRSQWDALKPISDDTGAPIAELIRMLGLSQNYPRED